MTFFLVSHVYTAGLWAVFVCFGELFACLREGARSELFVNSLGFANTCIFPHVLFVRLAELLVYRV